MYLGIDIGGTKMAAVVIDSNGTEAGRYRTATVKNGYRQFIDEVIRFIAQIEQDIGETLTPGIALPGSVSALSGKIKNSNILLLNGEDLQQDLRARLGRTVSLANDANCFALSEACDGAGRGSEVVFGLTLGTGCGGGLAIGRQIFSGAWGNAAECGHLTLPGYHPAADGPAVTCYCGRDNCSESFISGSGFAERYLQLTGDALSTPEILQLARTGHALALQQVARFRDQLARLLASVVNMVDPHVIVLGGGLSNEPLLVAEIGAQVAPNVFTDTFCTPVLTAVHGDSSGMRGAAWLARRAEAANLV